MENTILYLNLMTFREISVKMPEGKTHKDIERMDTKQSTVFMTFKDGTKVFYEDVLHDVAPDDEYNVDEWADETNDDYWEIEDMSDDSFTAPQQVNE